MWTPIKDCGKQLNTKYRIRQTVTDTDIYITEFEILEIDIDEYILQVVNKFKNDIAVSIDENERIVLTGDQIIGYQFEVWSG